MGDLMAGLRRIGKYLFRDIVGYDDVKDLLIRALKSHGDGLPVHFLLVGSPSTAKTQFLLALRRLKDAEYVLGSRTTRAGLSSLLIEKKPKILLIDEMDKMRDVDYGVLLSLCETGIVVETLHKRFRVEKLETMVIGACNDLSRIPYELQSRFIILKFKPYTFNKFRKVVKFVLTKKIGISTRMANKIAMLVWHELGSRDVRDAINIAKLVRNERRTRRVSSIIKTMTKYS